jgi:hypothetical protein
MAWREIAKRALAGRLSPFASFPMVEAEGAFTLSRIPFPFLARHRSLWRTYQMEASRPLSGITPVQ